MRYRAGARKHAENAEKPAKMRERGESAVARFLATLAVLLVVAAPLGRVVHLLRVPHGICAIHGDLVDLGAPVSHHRATTSNGPQSSIEGTDADDERQEHDHCDLVAAGSRDVAVLSGVQQDVQAPEPEVRTALEPWTLHWVSPRIVLLTAPKTSPPSTGPERA